MNKMKKILSGSLLIAGTTIGAGMLGIPLFTAQAGFWPAMGVTFLTWIIMLSTGLLFLEATLWMPLGSNLLSMSKKFLGEGGKWLSGATFLFLYYCLLVAYFAAGAPLLMAAFGLSLTGPSGYALFGVVFALIVVLGPKWIDRTNFILTVAMILVYFLLIGTGSPEVQSNRLAFSDWPKALFALPVLFSAFGYHNIIPSLCAYFEKDARALKLSIIIGTTIPLIIYLAWQWLIIGSIPPNALENALAQGLPVTGALQLSIGSRWVYYFGQAFAFFAIVTSLLGVAFSMVDFLADGMKIARAGWNRLWLVLATFLPPFAFVSVHPKIFDQALSVAGGIGEALLNGLIPIALVWIGRFRRNLDRSNQTKGFNRLFLCLLFVAVLFVLGLEIKTLVASSKSG